MSTPHPDNEVLRTPHPEAPFSTSPAFRVTLWVVDGIEVVDLRAVSYFVRCYDPSHAVVLAEKCWQKWERHADDYKARGEDPPVFPDTRGRGIAVCIDEGDWKEYLKDAIRFGAGKNLQLCGTSQMFSVAGVLKHPYPVCWTLPGLAFDVDESQRLRNQDLVDKDLPIHIFGGKDRIIGSEDDQD